MTTRAALFITLALLALLCTAYAALAQPRRDVPALAVPARRCVGVSMATLRSENPVITRVYRAFDDGTVETFDDGAHDAKWTTIK